jgi:phosphatidylserine/phosphatidylglycerophosphate/cardiolipin synthase-like enzyme
MNSLLSSRLYNNETFYDAFASDLRNAKRSVIIESPFITSKRMNRLLPVLRKLSGKGVQIIVNTRNPDEHDSEYASQAIYAIAMLQDIGVTVLYTVRHHRKLAIIDNEILWEGSLNILSQNDSCEIMRRIDSEQIAMQTVEFTGLARFL